MSNRLFVGNLAHQVTDIELGEMFAPYGTVRKAEVVRGRGGRGRGFGYVELSTEESAARAVVGLNGQEFQGRPVSLAVASSAAPRTAAQEADQRFEFSRGRGGGGGGDGRRPWNRR